MDWTPGSVARLGALAIVIALGACGGGTGEGESGDGPTVLSFTSNVTTMTEGEMVTFSAIVTDPQGIADVIGGSLLDADGAATYGTFSTSAQEGAYALTLMWSDINRTVPIEFTTTEPRVFVGRFFDQSGTTADAMVTVTLGCKNGKSACGGSCVDMKSDLAHCGTCATRCTQQANSCVSGTCRGTVCTSQVFGLPADCATACSHVGLKCGACYGTSNVGEGHNSNSCTDYIPGGPPAPDVATCNAPLSGAVTTSMQSVSCCCTQN